ncbi:hypothetical protein D9758_017329 [Tetrapyrgos nigripes]|uniref:SET domain-containing protein n=1 Tax=Tetrapyrgos nigripes TaxID=182062 RepID=A0A8H5BSE4_9AGAR|nr:hypothetical protein D9758_017329 [Tetrapyrgos nigripes]
MDGRAQASSFPELPQIRQLLSWCASTKIHIDPKLQIRPHDGGLAVFSSGEVIPPFVTLVKISKNAILSVKSTSIASTIRTESYGLEAQLGLALALYLEIAKGEDSKWFGYLQSLPSQVDLPVFWGLGSGTTEIDEDGKTALSWLKGSEVERDFVVPPRAKEAAINAFFENHTLPFFSKDLGDSFIPQSDGFHRAYSLVSSRAFLVDAYHGLSMVPIADAFNHTVENHVHLEVAMSFPPCLDVKSSTHSKSLPPQSEFEVCPECGSLQECPHDQDIDVDSSSASEHTRSKMRMAKDEEHDAYDDDCYEMVSNTGIPPFSEVFNTYGETLSNAQLLVQYGFLLDVNENDRITWNLEEVWSTGTDTTTLRVPLDLVCDMWYQVQEDLEKLCRRFDDTDSELIYYNAHRSPNSSSKRKKGHRDRDWDTFCINSDGKVSHQLWALCGLIECLKDGVHAAEPEGADAVAEMKTVVKILARMVEAQVKCEEEDHGDDDEEMVPDSEESTGMISLLLSQTASSILSLCRRKKASMGPENVDISTGDIGDMLDQSKNETRNDAGYGRAVHDWQL